MKRVKGSLSDNDGDGNEDVKKAIGLIRKTTTLHVHHAFFVHFFTVHARLSTGKCLTASLWTDVNKVQIISFSLFKCIPQEISFIEIGLVCHIQQIGIKATSHTSVFLVLISIFAYVTGAGLFQGRIQ